MDRSIAHDDGERDGEQSAGERQGGCAARSVVYEWRRGGQDAERGQSGREVEAFGESAHGEAPCSCPVPAPGRGETVQPASAAPGRLFQIEARRSLTVLAPRFDRRALLLGGAAASLWAWRGGASVAAPARRLTAAPASQALAPPPAAPTRLLAYEGTVPGPLIRLRRGEALALDLANRLDAPTTLSFPGLRSANAFAGIAGLTQAPIEPGGEAEIRFTPPDAGFNLYLPDAGAATARQLAAGLFGPIVVEESSPPAVDLEAAVVLADWRLDETAACATIPGRAERSSPPARRPRRSGSPLRRATAFVCASPTLRRRGR